MIAIVVAVDAKNGIGLNGSIPWILKEDMKYFKDLTMGGTVVMGRNTFDSLPPAYRPLPNRRNIVLSRVLRNEIEGVEVLHSIDDAIEACQLFEKIFIIGGGEIYKATMDIADVLYVTHIEQEFFADTFFPEIDEKIWKLSNEKRFEKGEKFEHPFRFCQYVRVG